MKFDKKTIILMSFLFVFLILGITGISYAYFQARVIGQGNQNILVAGDLTLNFNDSSTVSLNNIYPGEFIQKTFSVQNASDRELFYNIQWKSLNNTFTSNEIQIEYTCIQYTGYGTASQAVSGTCSGMTPRAVGTSYEPIYSNINIGEGKTHEYTVKIAFVETGELQNYNKGQSFNGVLDIVGTIDTETRWYQLCQDNDTLKCKIINAQSSEPDSGLVFDQPSSVSGDLGLYYTYDTSRTEDITNDGIGERVYFYRGAVTNNYVVFAGYCWRIVRTNESGSVRLRFGGTPTISEDNFSCPQTGTDVYAYANILFNSQDGDNRYVGYMYGNTCTSYETCHANDVNSNMKNVLEGWYESKLLNYSNLIADEIYCNDRTIAQGGQYNNTTNTKLGYGTNSTSYGFFERLLATGDSWLGGLLGGKPTYKCIRELDKFTVSSIIGNGKNRYSIGLLTADEISYAGGEFYNYDNSSFNTTFYLYTSQYYWAMSPGIFSFTYFSSHEAIVASRGNIGLSGVLSESAPRVLPVISLIPGALVTSGTGAYNSPYIIQ